MEKTVAEQWYTEKNKQYDDLRQAAERLLETLLKENGISYHSVTSRLKARDSYVKKCEDPKYESPEQIMDVAALRIITQTTMEVEQVCGMIEREFAVDPENSCDKAKEMGVNKVGYLSVHYVVRMSPQRLELKEYSRFEGLCWEIQVRSLLQHAWAEIEHDRGYKFAGKLPKHIERKFHLVAANLELMDEEFRSLVGEIDAYAEEVKKETQEGNLDIPIDSTSLLSFLDEYFKDYRPELLAAHYQENSKDIVDELEGFGIHSLGQLKELLNAQEEFLWSREDGDYTTYLGLLRNAMVLSDAEKYFRCAWNEHWTLLREYVEAFWKKHGVEIDGLGDILHMKRNEEKRVVTLSSAHSTAKSGLKEP